MSNGRKPRPKPRAPRPRKTRAKLDARFDWLLSQPEKRIASLVKEDHARIGEAHKELDRAHDSLDADREHDPDELRKAFEPAERLMFAPVTAGLLLPGVTKRPPFRLAKPYASVLIRSEASSDDLRQMGARVRTRSGSIVTAFVPLDRIPRLEQSSVVEAVELARPLLPTLDQTIPYVGLNTLQAGPPAHTGAGVIVGVLDTVLDVYHPDFRTAAGQSRVRFLWDQRLVPAAGEAGPPTAPALPGFTPAGGTTYGVEYSQANINAELNQPAGTPPYGIVRHGGTVGEHGTHTTGIAAGNGLAGNVPPRVGAAPGADIIFVAARGVAGTALFADSTVLADGAAYIFARAAALGQPAVMNVSLGDNIGPHDGTMLGEVFLDGLLGVPGRAICLSAGNSTGTAAHASGSVPAGGTTNLVLNYAAGTHFSDIAEIWYDGHDRFSVTVTAPDGTVIGPLAAGAGSVNATLPGGPPAVQVTLTSVVGDPRNGDNLITLLLSVPSGAALTGNWTIALTGTTVINGRFETWVDRNNRGLSAFQAPLLDEQRLTLGQPGTCRRAISVGNHDRSGPPPALRPSSGLGPTRDGRVKPDITTVGTNVNAPRSRNMASAAPGAFYISMSGTSMSSPLVAGTLALVFECRGPAATWFDLLQVLQDNASTAMPAGVPPAPNVQFGYGWMQAANLCNPAPGNVDVWVRDGTTDSGIEPSSVSTPWLCPDIEVLDTAGNPVPNPTHSPTARFNNRIRVTARNRGARIARNVEVFLYWGDPGTNIPFPSEWRSTGIFAGAAPNFPDQTNRIVIPQIAPGGSQAVEFAWAPPAPGSNIAADDHFCLLTRLEHPADPSQIAAGGWSVITARNNIGLRNTHVQPNDTGGDAETAFNVLGSSDDDSLVVISELVRGAIRVELPVAALPWRDAKLLEKTGSRQAFGRKRKRHPLDAMELSLKGEEVTERTGVVGAETIEVKDGTAVLRLEADRLLIPSLRVDEGAKMPLRVRVDGIRTKGERRYVHVAQLAGGRRLGGVSLELWKGMKPPR